MARIVSYTQAQIDKLLGTVTAKAYGVAASTGDSAAALRTAASIASSRGVPLVLPPGDISLGSRVNLPSGLTVIANGARFKGLTATGDFLLSFGINSQVVGTLEVQVAAGSNVRGVQLTSDTNIDKLVIKAPAAGAGDADLNDSALLIQSAANVNIDVLQIENFDFPLKIANANNVKIPNTRIRNYVRGLYITDSKDVQISGVIYGASPNTSITAGRNGLLIDATAHGASSNLRFSHLTVMDAGEHSYRIGGNKRVSDVRFSDCSSINSGGCGFKVLGGTFEDANYHEDIYITNPLIEDAGQTPENASGVQMEFVRRGNVINPVIQRRNKPYSAGFGVQLQRCVDVSTVNPIISDTLVAGYAVRHVLGDSTNVTLTGGKISSSSGDGVLLMYTGRIFRRVSVEGFPQIEIAGTGTSINIVNEGGQGAVVGGSWITWQSVSAAARQVAGLLAGYYADVRAAYVPDTEFKIGSRWTDNATGVTRERRTALWSEVTNVVRVKTVTRTGSHTLALVDEDVLVEVDSASPNNVTVPPSSAVNYPVGTTIGIRQYGSGQTSVVAGAGVLIRSRGNAFKLAGQYAEAALTKRGLDEWILTGDVVS